MADEVQGAKISELPAASDLDGSEVLAGVQSSQTKKFSLSTILAWIKSGLTKADVNLGNVANILQYSADNPPPTYASTPEMDGVGSAGSGTAFALGNHVHPSDTRKADKTDLTTIRQTSPTCSETNGIAAGQYFYLDDVLVKAKQAISSGDTFTDGTNYEAADGALNELKNAIDAENVTSKITFASGITNVSSRSNAYKSGKLVVFTFQLKDSLTAASSKTLATIDSSIAPKDGQAVFALAQVQDPSNGNHLGFAIVYCLNGNLNITAVPSYTGTGAITGQIVWATK